jgi:transcriptional repressor NF-X1
MACHAPAKCPENDPCQAIITMSCACGHVQQRTSCGASTNNTTSREKTVLKCNSECAIRQRNARLADALGISGNGPRGPEVEWDPELKKFAMANLAFIKVVEKTLDEFVKGTKGSMILPYSELHCTRYKSEADGVSAACKAYDGHYARRRLPSRTRAG